MTDINFIHNYLADSLKQNNENYKNIINATHPYPYVVFVKRMLIKIKSLSNVQTVNIGFILNVMVPLMRSIIPW